MDRIKIAVKQVGEQNKFAKLAAIKCVIKIKMSALFQLIVQRDIGLEAIYKKLAKILNAKKKIKHQSLHMAAS